MNYFCNPTNTFTTFPILRKKSHSKITLTFSSLLQKCLIEATSVLCIAKVLNSVICLPDLLAEFNRHTSFLRQTFSSLAFQYIQFHYFSYLFLLTSMMVSCNFQPLSSAPCLYFYISFYCLPWSQVPSQFSLAFLLVIYLHDNVS